MSITDLPITEGGIGAAILYMLWRMNASLTYIKIILNERLK